MIGGVIGGRSGMIGGALAALRGGGFTPAAISGLRAWYKADSLVLADGAAVAQWDDSSGNGYHLTQATGTKQPAYRSSDVAVDFDGGDSLDRTGISAFAVARSLIAIVAKPDLNTSERFWFLAREAVGFTTMMRYRSSTPTGHGININALTANINSGLSTAAWQLWVGYADAGNVYLRRNGVQVATASGTPTTRNVVQMHVGSEASAGNYFDGRMKELVYVTRPTASEFSLGDITALESYLIARHNIT